MAGAALKSNAGGNTSPYPYAPQIYKDLIAAGASSTQAIGIMGNMIAESGLNPESSGMDSNGYVSYGLVSWNSAPGNYPNAASLVTGNPSADIKAQIALLKSSGAFSRASGSTVQAAASNFAHNYERCAACGYNQGSSELTVRANNASNVLALLKGGGLSTDLTPTASSSGSTTITTAVASNWLQVYSAIMQSPNINHSAALFGLLGIFAGSSSSVGKTALFVVARLGTFALGAALFIGGLAIVLGVPVVDALKGKGRTAVAGALGL